MTSRWKSLYILVAYQLIGSRSGGGPAHSPKEKGGYHEKNQDVVQQDADQKANEETKL